MKNKLLILITFTLLLSGCFRKEPPKPRLVLKKTKFSKISGWDNDSHKKALIAFKKSCAVIDKKNPDQFFSSKIPS